MQSAVKRVVISIVVETENVKFLCYNCDGERDTSYKTDPFIKHQNGAAVAHSTVIRRRSSSFDEDTYLHDITYIQAQSH